MDRDDEVAAASGAGEGKGSGIQYLVESALRSVATNSQDTQPRTRQDWVELICTALMSDSGTSHRAVLSSLIATGVPQREILDSVIPAASRLLGEMWIEDRASFVDVTVGASRLQTIYRESADGGRDHVLDRTIPLGQSVLMVVPEFEQHSLGAFSAADQFRRYGLWVRMAIGLDHHELSKLMNYGGFSLVGLTVGSSKSVEQVTELIDYLRTKAPACPPIYVGGNVVEDTRLIERRTGADYAVRSVREAVERCGLAPMRKEIPIDSML